MIAIIAPRDCKNNISGTDDSSILQTGLRYSEMLYWIEMTHAHTAWREMYGKVQRHFQFKGFLKLNKCNTFLKLEVNNRDFNMDQDNCNSHFSINKQA